MLAMRARGFNLRDAFPDVLGGMYLTEELQGEAIDVTPAIPTPPTPPPVIVPPKSTLRKQLEASIAEIEAEKGNKHAFDFEAFRAALSSITSIDEANGVWNQFVENANSITSDETEEAQRILAEICEPFWKEKA